MDSVSTSQDQTQEIFRRLKAVCVPLLGSSLLTSTSTPDVFKYLSQLNIILHDFKESGCSLTPNLISYTFFPLSTLLRRNNAPDIPDYILEKVFNALAVLCDDWWWECDPSIWEQIFIFCGAIISGIDGKGTGKGKVRDDETKEAAGRCLFVLLRDRTQDPVNSTAHPNRVETRLKTFQSLARSVKFLPVLGQTLDSLLITVDTPHLPLQRVSLLLLSLIIGVYAPDGLVPSVLPGVVSRMTRTALGNSTKKGWANGESVAGALEVMQYTIVRSLANDICMKEGAIHPVVGLEELAQTLDSDDPVPEPQSFSTLRTPSWLRGTSSQLLIALNSLTPLVSHPTPSALLALSKFAATIVDATSLTLPDIRVLLLHWLLTLTNSYFPSVSTESRGSLLSLLTTPSQVQLPLQQTLLRTTHDNLLALPRLLPIHADTKVEHAAGIIEAVCRLVSSSEGAGAGSRFISNGIGKLLGPTGGIEKWGWSLLSVLELSEPPATLSAPSSAQLMLETSADMSHWTSFPVIGFQNVFSSSTRDALERMFRALGRTSGDGCLYSVEWFASIGRTGSESRSVTAMWCACRLLEGVGEISLSQENGDKTIPARRSKRLTSLARTFGRSIAELWDEFEQENPTGTTTEDDDFNDNTLVQHVKGIETLHENLRITRPTPAKHMKVTQQPVLHRALSLQAIAVSAGILQAQFTTLLLYTFYPILRSLVSPDACLASTALATLNYVTIVTSYASPANLLLSNFDYALDAVSRRLSRRWLDVEATKVLALTVRLVGNDIVERAGDVVEECFDRLDEFHGYSVVVEGLVQVLSELIKVVQEDRKLDPNPAQAPNEAGEKLVSPMDGFFHWLRHRGDHLEEEVNTTDYGPAPREAWGKEKAPEAEHEDSTTMHEPDPNADPPLSAIQTLTKQIVSRSLYFLTHGSPVIRARILSLLNSSVPVLPESALLPSIHYAWPFILNRLSDPESLTVGSAASLIESLATHFGSFMYRKIWDDVWPKFRMLLKNLDVADATNALSRRGIGAVGTESAYTHSHRTYRSVINTMTAAAKAVHLQETSTWELLLAFRRFLHREAHEELQQCARNLYLAIGKNEPDAVWLVLSSTAETTNVAMQFLAMPRWDIKSNAGIILQDL